jgi:hypothetical protein
MRSSTILALGLVVASPVACAPPPQADVSVMMMGPRFDPKPDNCAIEFTRADITTVNLTHHIIAQIRVTGVDPRGGMLSDEITPKVRAVLQPAACKLGADTVAAAPTMGAMGAYGAFSSVGFYILKKRTTPLAIPPGMVPPGMTPPAPPPPADKPQPSARL